MNIIQKYDIKECLIKYCERYDSQNKAARTLKGVSAATISQIINNNWELITDSMWRNIASQIGYKDSKWSAVETKDYKRLFGLLGDAKENSLVLSIIGDAGTGKTFAVKKFVTQSKQSYLLCCNEYWNRKLFLSELLTQMGCDYSGYTVGEMMQEVVRTLKKQDNAILILDEADKLSDQVLYFFITLYNELEDECGIVLLATDHLEKRLKKGLKLNKKGYKEIWSRIGRKCIQLNGVSTSDIVAICEANGIKDSKIIDKIITESDADLRRVKRLVHAYLHFKKSDIHSIN